MTAFAEEVEKAMRGGGEVSEMFENVAAAIRVKLVELGIGLNNIDVAPSIARAAIEAMRTPTPDMYIAAYAANGGKWTSAEFEPPPKECWKSMIDASNR